MFLLEIQEKNYRDLQYMNISNTTIIVVLLLATVIIYRKCTSEPEREPDMSWTQFGGAEAPEPVPIAAAVQAPEPIPVPVPIEVAPQTSTVAESGFNNVFVMVNQPFTSDGLVTHWKYTAEKQGSVVFIVVEKSANGLFTIKGENPVQILKPGEQVQVVPAATQIAFAKGDFIGFKSVGKTVLIRDDKAGSRMVQSNSSKELGINSTLDNVKIIKDSLYRIEPKTRAVFRATKNLGSEEQPAKSAAHILAHYKANQLGTPANGVYWIKCSKKAKPVEVFCNFSIRAGYGYMLVASVEPQGGWAKISSVTGKFGVPFNPNFSYGTYDKYGRSGTYYMKWSQLDRNAIADSDPTMCRGEDVVWNAQGKYCGQRNGKRLSLSGGVDEILLATGNSKYWASLSRVQIEAANGTQQLKPIATSNNFVGQCEPNKNVTVVTNEKDSAPWINMGSAHACGNNYMLWGEDGSLVNEKFKNDNDGVRVYIGTKAQEEHKKKGGYRFNPTNHTAPGRAETSASYAEAQNVCRSFGKMVCTKPQMDAARQSGYGSNICGWTNTPQDKFSMVTENAVSTDVWADDLEEGKEVNVCKPQNTRNGRSGVYCCDQFEFLGFRYLDKPYNHAGVWLVKFEQLFERLYGNNVPVGSKFIVWKHGAVNNKRQGVSVHKETEHTYVAISHKDGIPPKNKTVEQKCQISSSLPLTTRATWLMNAPLYDFKEGTQVSSTTARGNILRYGAKIKLFNKSSKQYLAGTRNPYWHLQHSKYRQDDMWQVVAYHDAANSGSVWKVQSVNTTVKDGEPIKNGDLIELVHETTGAKMALNANRWSPSRITNYKLVTLYPVNNNVNDCLWRISGEGKVLRPPKARQTITDFFKERKFNPPLYCRSKETWGKVPLSEVKSIPMDFGSGATLNYEYIISDQGLGNSTFGRMLLKNTTTGKEHELKSSASRKGVTVRGAVDISKYVSPGDKIQIRFLESRCWSGHTMKWYYYGKLHFSYMPNVKAIAEVTSSFINIGDHIRFNHSVSGHSVELTGKKHNTKRQGGTTVHTIAGSKKYNNTGAWQVQLVKDKTYNDRCQHYLNRIKRARHLAKVYTGPSRAKAVQIAKKVISDYNKQCYEIPVAAYNRAMSIKQRDVREQLKLLSKETGLFNEYNDKLKSVRNQFEQLHQQSQNYQSELDKLKAKNCVPVKKCVDKLHRKHTKVAETCKKLDPLTKDGQITDELIAKIREVKRVGKDVNHFPVELHDEHSKYVKSSNIIPC